MAFAVERLPPHNLDAEQSVLGSLLIDRDAVIRIASYVKPSDFYRSAHGIIYEAILNLYNRREPTDLVTLVDELRRTSRLDDAGGETYLTELIAAVPTAVHVEYYGRIVERTATLRRLIGAGTEIVEIGYDEARDVEDALDSSERAIFAVSQRRSTRDFRSIAEVLEAYFDRLDTLHQHKGTVVGVPTGFADLDRLTGGLQRSDLIIIAARPAVGKSSLGLGIAYNAAVRYDKTVGLFVLEMSAEQIVQRLLSMETGIDSHRLRMGYIDDSEWSSVTRAFGRLAEANIFVDDTASANIMEVRSKARRLHAERGLDLLIIDYLQLMTSSRPENRVQEISSISRSLKGLARELDIPVVALAQLSRAVESRQSHVPMLSDLRESGCLTADTRILRADTGAMATMGELLERGERDIPVWCMGDDLKLALGRMTHVFPSGVKPVYRVRLASGREIKASGNHPLLTLNGWRSLSDLKAGDRIGLPRRIEPPTTEEHWEASRLILLAHLIGDGSVLARYPVRYATASIEHAKCVADAASSAFGITARIKHEPRARSFQVFLPAPYRLTHGKRNPIAQWFTELGLFDKRAHEKFVPTPVFGLNDDQVGLFLRHLWSTDGHVGIDARHGVTMYFASTSRRLVEDVALLLLRFGIVARIKTTRKRGYRDSYQLWIYGVEHQRAFLNGVGLFGVKTRHEEAIRVALAEAKSNTNADTIPRDVWGDVRSLMRSAGITHRAYAQAMGTTYGGSAHFKFSPSRLKLQAVATLLKNQRLQQLAASDVFWDRITSIEPAGDEPVFDATVIGYHNFIADGVVVHNSIEQDADIVAFIYREDVYDQDTDRKGIADLIVAKHRNGPVGTVHLRFFDRTARFADLELYREPEL
jgi:replicative DNA helicase